MLLLSFEWERREEEEEEEGEKKKKRRRRRRRRRREEEEEEEEKNNNNNNNNNINNNKREREKEKEGRIVIVLEEHDIRQTQIKSPSMSDEFNFVGKHVRWTSQVTKQQHFVTLELILHGGDATGFDYQFLFFFLFRFGIYISWWLNVEKAVLTEKSFHPFCFSMINGDNISLFLLYNNTLISFDEYCCILYKVHLNNTWNHRTTVEWETSFFVNSITGQNENHKNVVVSEM